MPTYRKQQLGTGGSVAPAVAPLGALKPMLAQPAVEVMRALDRVAQQGRRVVARLGIQGTNEWGVAETNPEGNSQTYPLRTTWRERARFRFELAPGHGLIVRGWCLPAGETNRDATPAAPPWVPDGRHGRIRLAVTFTARDATTSTATHVITTPGSTLQYGGTDHSAGAALRDMLEIGPIAIMPSGFLTNAATQRLYSSQHCTVDLVFSVQGSPRVGDLYVYEEPLSWSCADTDGVTYRTQGANFSTPDAPHLPPKFPRYRNSALDLRGGTYGLLATVAAQRQRLGPMLLHWTAFEENLSTYATDYTARTTTSDTFVGVVDPSLTTWSASSPGFSMSCGGYARDWRSAGYFVFRDRTAAIPVLVRVRGQGITAGTSTVRVQTSACSFVDVVLPVGAVDWQESYGWLEVGINPDQASNAMIFMRHVGASGSCSVEAVQVYHCAGTIPVA